jgi:hypothetical protein
MLKSRGFASYIIRLQDSKIHFSKPPALALGTLVESNSLLCSMRRETLGEKGISKMAAVKEIAKESSVLLCFFLILCCLFEGSQHL